jgi:hypothetical protein
VMYICGRKTLSYAHGVICKLQGSVTTGVTLDGLHGLMR